MAMGGTEQGKPAKAGHCSGRRDPAPGVWGHSVPKKPSRTSAAREQAAGGSGRGQIPSCPELCSLSVSLCVPTTCLLIVPFTWKGCSQHPPTLDPEPGISPNHLPGTGIRHVARDRHKPPEKTERQSILAGRSITVVVLCGRGWESLRRAEARERVPEAAISCCCWLIYA